MHHFLEMTNHSQHRQHSFYNHARVPLASTTYLQVVWQPALFDETLVDKDDHIWQVFVHNLLKSSPIIHIGSIHIPIDDQTQVIQDETQFSTHNLALIG